MQPRERFIAALDRQPVEGHVPHFELNFFLTMEVLGKVHPSHRNYFQWEQMSAKEQNLHIEDMADLYIDIADSYHHDAIFVQSDPPILTAMMAIMERIREKSGDRFFLMMHGDPTFSIPGGDGMMDFSMRMMEDMPALKEEAEEGLQICLKNAEILAAHPGLLDGFALCSDYCFNTNPFFSPSIFAEIIAPYLKRVIDGYHSFGFRTIKHTDGNIMPILDQLVECGPDALHSLDPQGGVTIPEVRKVTKGRVALCGNVNCALLQTGSEAECIDDVRRSLREGMSEPGYIFCTSNCVYTGLSLERYELMYRIWREEGIYRG
ncbi:MAG: uroporphyrinogen decarboxylase family protein [Oscillospiraceae bacterium]